MRIALIIEEFNPAAGGAERSTLQIAQQLVARGHEVTIVTSMAATDQVPQGVSVMQLGKKTRSATRLRNFSKWAVKTLDEGRFDTSLSVTTSVPAAVLQPRSGTVRESNRRNVAMRHGAIGRAIKQLLLATSLKKRAQLALEKQTIHDPRVKRIVAISEYVVTQLSEHYSVSRERVEVIPNAATMPVMSEQERAAARLRVRGALGIADETVAYLFAAHNPRLKGFAPLLGAMKKLADAKVDAVLIVAGGSGYALHDDAVSAQVRDRVRFVGATSRMADLYVAADVTVLPTFFDPSSKVVIESLMMGTPAISTSYNGASDFIAGSTGSDRGRVVKEPDDVTALAQAMHELADATERKRCSLATAGMAEQLSMKVHVDRLESVLRDAAGRAS
jgi:UDP-glucose:(heptosyl)LPS alpha-1,3-glucosyltransferase